MGFLLLSLLCGCSTGDDPVASATPNETELQPGLQLGVDNDWAVDSPMSAPPLGFIASARDVSKPTQLASFVLRSKRPFAWNLGGFDNASIQSADQANSDSAVRLAQAPRLPGDGSGTAAVGGSDDGKVEIVPTPPAQAAVKGEVVPTPRGTLPQVPGQTDPVARIAADLEGSKSAKLRKSGSAIGPEVAKMKTLGKPALIDATMELGVVGNQQGPEDYRQWAKPDVVLFITGNQHGYIEPCGCTGLEKQKGGVARRYTFINQLRGNGWDLVPIDAGNQIRRIGQQASIKFEKSSTALSEMKYQAVGFGPSDMRLSATDLISVTYAETPADAMYVSANIVLIDPSLLPTHQVVRKGEWAIGLTSVLDPDALDAPVSSDITISPIVKAASTVLQKMNADGANFRVLTFFGEEAAAKQLMVDVPGYDLIAVSGGYGEPTYRPQSIEGSDTKMIVTGNKGMFAGLVALYQNRPMKYARVPLTHEFKDAPEMRKLMADYQQQLEQLGLSGLGISPIPHPSGKKFVGTATCAKCHEDEFDVWENSPHANATNSIVTPGQGRGDVARHFDPECISCHVTGWNPQNYYPYESGYLSLKMTPHLTDSGCENCHGPGASHVAAEQANSGASDKQKMDLRLTMQLPLEKAKEHCMKCHDLDNSPDFHDEGAFEDIYWPEVEH